MKRFLKLAVIIITVLCLCGCTAVRVLFALANAAQTFGEEPAVQETAEQPAESAVQENEDGITEHPVYEGHTTVPFSELEYVHYDPAEFYAAVDSFRALADTPDSFDRVTQKYEWLYGEVVSMFTRYSVIMIDHYVDVSDTALSDEYTDCSTELTNMIDAIAGAARDMLKSELYAEQFEKYLGEDNTEAYSEYEDLTPREKELGERETELCNEYYRVFEDESLCSYVENGEEWTFTSAAEAYENGSISYESYERLYYKVYERLNEVLGDIYIKLIDIRVELAELAGYDNYAEYAYEEVYCRDYTPAQAREFEDKLKKEFGPRYFAIPGGEDDGSLYIPPMSSDEILDTINTYLCPMDERVQEAFDFMTEYGYYVIDDDAAMADAGFTTTIYEHNAPFIFMHTYGEHTDLSSVSHEFGHYLNGYYNRQDNVMFGGETFDILEVHSTAMEFLLSDHYDDIYGTAADYVREKQYYNQLDSVLMGCVYDEFQQYIYTHPDMTLDEINSYYRSVTQSYGYNDPAGEDYSYGWMLIPHNFESPMYYISYATSALTAMDIWSRSLEDYDGAVEEYLEFLSYGSVEYGYLELLEKCGMDSFLDNGYLERVTDPVFRAIGNY